MREIKFRAKEIGYHWVYGDLVRDGNFDSTLIRCKNGIYANVDYTTVGQFTGLYDYVIYDSPKVSEIGQMPKSEDFRNRKDAEVITKTISSSNNISNNINPNKTIPHITI